MNATATPSAHNVTVLRMPLHASATPITPVLPR